MRTMMVLFLVSLTGFIATRRGWIDHAGVSGLTRLLVDVVVPAKMLTAMLAGLNSQTLSQCGAIIGLFAVWKAAFLLFAMGATRLWPGGKPAENRAIWCLSAFQNGIYVPLPLILALVPPEREAEATVYVGGAVIVMILYQWTLGVWLIRGREENSAKASTREALKGALNPPLVSIIIGAALAFIPPFAEAARTGQGHFLITVPIEAAQLAGSALGPLAMLVLGMMIGECHLGKALKARTLTIVIGLRLLLSPIVMLALLLSGFFPWATPLLALVIIVEAASPPATNLSVIARRYGGDWQLISSALFITYLLALFTLPAFTAIILMR